MWTHHLSSKCIRNNRPEYNGRTVDDFHILTQETRVAENIKLLEKLKRRPSRYDLANIKNNKSRTVCFIQDCGDRYYIGVDGHIEDILGKDCSYAVERTIFNGQEEIGRSILFTHGFFASKHHNPFIPDLKELLAVQRDGLEEILRRANNGEEPVIISAATFSKPRESSEWSLIATQIEQGNHLGSFAIFTMDGQLIEWLAAEPLIAQKTDAASLEPIKSSPPALGALLQKLLQGLLGSTNNEEKHNNEYIPDEKDVKEMYPKIMAGEQQGKNPGEIAAELGITISYISKIKKARQKA